MLHQGNKWNLLLPQFIAPRHTPPMGKMTNKTNWEHLKYPQTMAIGGRSTA